MALSLISQPLECRILCKASKHLRVCWCTEKDSTDSVCFHEQNVTTGTDLQIYTSERKQRLWCLPTTIKLKFHGTDTDSDTDTRILVRKSACPATSPCSLPQARHARQSSPTCPPTRPTRAFPRVTHVTSSMRFYTLLSCGFIHYLNAFSSSINAFS